MRRLLIIIVALTSLQASGQFYPMEAGGVGGYSSGVNFRVYLEEQLSYEALLCFRGKGVQFNLLRQEHTELHYSYNGSLNLVYGYGAHAGFYITDHYNIFFREVYLGENIFTPVAGIDGYVALEYRFNEAPFSVGLRVKPYMEVSLKQIFGINMFDFGLTFKYRFKPSEGYY